MAGDGLKTTLFFDNQSNKMMKQKLRLMGLLCLVRSTILHKNSETASIFCLFPRQSNVVGVMGGLFGVKMIIWKQHCFVGGGT